MEEWKSGRVEESGGEERLLGADGLDLLALNADFDAEGRAEVAALHDGTADPHVASEAGSSQGVIQSAAAGIADERMRGVTEVVIGEELVQVSDVLQLTIAVRSAAGEGPIACRGGGRAARKANDGGGNVLAGEPVANKKVHRRPRLGKIRNRGDGGIVLIGVGKQSVGIWRGRRNFDLGSRLGLIQFRWPGMREPAQSQQENDGDST